jgi:hypothetical protein
MAGEYGVNIKFRAIGLSQLDKAKAKAKELETSVSKIRSLDLGKAIRGPVGDQIAEATGQIKRYAQQINKTGKVIGKTQLQQEAALEAFENLRKQVKVGGRDYDILTEAIKNQNLAIAKQNELNIKSNQIRKKQKMFPGMSQGFLANLREGVMGGGALQSGLVSGAFPLLFGQGPLGGAAGFAGGFLGTKMGGQMGGFAGGLVATAVLQQLTTAKEKLEELGKAVTFFSFDVSAATNALGLAGTPQAEYIKLIEKSQGKQAAFNLVMQDMEKLVGEDGVQALQDFAESTRELQSSITKFITQVAAKAAELFTGGSERVTGLRRRQILGEAKTSTDKEVMNLVAERETATRKRKAEIDEEIIALMLSKEENKKNLDLEKLRAEQYRGITKSVTDKNLFLNESLSLGTREAQIQEKLREFDRKALEFDKEINQQKRDQFENALRLQQELERVNNLYQGIASTIQSGLVDAIEGAINGTKTLGDVARSVFGSIQRQLLDFGVNALLSSIPGFGAFFRRANGGPVTAGQSYIVGERGPEMFVPNAGGRIVSNEKSGAGTTNIVVNVDASGSGVEGDEQDGRELGLLISAAVQSEIIQQQRPGGLLA